MRGQDAPGAGPAGRRGTTSGAPRLAGKPCWGRGGLLPSFLRGVEGLGWDVSSLFLSVEGYGHVVNLSCPIQAAGALSAGPSPRLGPTTLHLQQPSLHTLPLPQMHILFIASLLRQAPACKEHVLVAETGGEWGTDYLK